jgi:hypothetical protein
VDLGQPPKLVGDRGGDAIASVEREALFGIAARKGEVAHADREHGEVVQTHRDAGGVARGARQGERLIEILLRGLEA